MKYFTPELLDRFRSDDVEISNQADKEWDLKEKEYVQEIKNLKLSHKLMKYNFHDFMVLHIFNEETYNIVLEKGKEFFILMYHLTKPPNIIKHKIESGKSNPLEWQYDEFGENAYYTHNILLTSGIEIELEFDKVKVEQFTYKGLIWNF